MRVLITGGAGFIGSHLAEEHVKRGDQVVVLDDLSVGNEENLAKIRKQITFIKGDCTDPTVFDRAAQGIQGIHHLAAVVGVDKYMQAPAKCALENTKGVQVACDYAQRYKAKLVYASSSEVYGKPKADLLTEESDCHIGHGPRWSYAISKRNGEYIVDNLPNHAISVRLFNVVGPRQSLGYCMSNFVNAASKSQRIQVYGDGKQKRTFCHVRDIAWGLAELMHSKKANRGVFNLGGTEVSTIKDLAEKVFEIAGTLKDDQNRIQLVPYEKKYTADPEDPQKRACDCSRVADVIGWEPKHTLEQMIKDSLNGALKGK